MQPAAYSNRQSTAAYDKRYVTAAANPRSSQNSQMLPSEYNIQLSNIINPQRQKQFQQNTIEYGSVSINNDRNKQVIEESKLDIKKNGNIHKILNMQDISQPFNSSRIASNTNSMGANSQSMVFLPQILGSRFQQQVNQQQNSSVRASIRTIEVERSNDLTRPNVTNLNQTINSGKSQDTRSSQSPQRNIKKPYVQKQHGFVSNSDLQTFEPSNQSNYRINSTIAKKNKKHQKSVKNKTLVASPNASQELILEGIKVKKQQEVQKIGIFNSKSPKDRNKIQKYETKQIQFKRKKSLTKKLNQASVQSLFKDYKAVNSKAVQQKNYDYDDIEKQKKQMGDGNSSDDSFVPDMKDYQRVIQKGMQRLKAKNYDDWSLLIKLCFHDSFKAQAKLSSHMGVNSVELMRFHPLFNQMSHYGVKDIIKCCKLAKVQKNKCLYRHEEKNSKVYIVLSGKIALHHDVLGALGVLNMEHCLGEEAQIDKAERKYDAAYGISEVYLFEYEASQWSSIKQTLITTGNRNDYLILDKYVQKNFQQKKCWRQSKELQYSSPVKDNDEARKLKLKKLDESIAQSAVEVQPVIPLSNAKILKRF